jgi:tartrate-resistant acid phosphatase type 5
VPHTPDCVADEHNFRFKDVFEAVYSAPALQDLPFRVTAGNHDHHGNVSAQIAYTNLSARWYYPDWYYSWTRSYTDKASGEAVTVEVAMLDTVILTNAFELNDTVVGPPPEAQWAWLEGVLNSSKADFLWVGGQ